MNYKDYVDRINYFSQRDIYKGIFTFSRKDINIVNVSRILNIFNKINIGNYKLKVDRMKNPNVWYFRLESIDIKLAIFAFNIVFENNGTISFLIEAISDGLRIDLIDKSEIIDDKIRFQYMMEQGIDIDKVEIMSMKEIMGRFAYVMKEYVDAQQ